MKKLPLILIGIILIGLIGAGVYYFSQNESISQQIIQEPDSEKLDFCSTEQECYDYLLEDGITKEMLTAKGVIIECSLLQCYAKRI